MQVKLQRSLAGAYELGPLCHSQLGPALEVQLPPLLDDFQHLPYGFSSLHLFLRAGRPIEFLLLLGIQVV